MSAENKTSNASAKRFCENASANDLKIKLKIMVIPCLY